MITCLIYTAAIVAANLSISFFGVWVSPINSFLFIGLDLALRDKLHNTWEGKQLLPKMLGLIVTAGVLSYLLNPAAGMIAIASSSAFVLAALADGSVYHWLRREKFLVKSNGSNVAGAAVDSLAFPTIAFGVLMPEIVIAQFIAKVSGGFVWSLIIRRFWL